MGLLLGLNIGCLARYFKYNIALLLLSFVTPSAHASERWDFVQTTCSTDFDYFALRTITLDQDLVLSLPKTEITRIGPENLRKVISKQNEAATGMHLSQSSPYKCTLSKGKIKAEIVDSNDATGKGECGAVPNFSLSIKINDIEVDRFSAFGAGVDRCRNPRVHLIEITPDWLRDCDLPDLATFLSDDKQIATCKRIKLN